MNQGGNTPGKAPPCVPTWKGHIETTKDALMIFQGCFDGTLAHTFRRPHDRERNSLIVSGNVFVYEEATSGIKRWTDGIPWSPSRILTNFLIYRQLNSPFPPGEKKRATKRSQRPLKPGEPYPTSGSANGTPTTDKHDSSFAATPRSTSPSRKKEDSPEKDSNRGLVGSLVDSYEFKENGLLKKTMTVTVQNVQHHLVSYYSLDDAKYNLKTPREDPRLKDVQITERLLQQPKFKFPNLDDAGDGTFDQMEGAHNGYPQYYHNGYDPSRMYPASAPAAYHANQPYPYQGAYAPSHPPPPNGASYAHMPPATGSYQPANPPAHYPQHPSHGQYYQQHGQHVPQYQQPQQSPQYPPQQYQQMHQQAPVQLRHPSVKSESTPRANGASYEYAPHAEAAPAMYSGGGVSGPPQSNNGAPVAQPQQSSAWPVGYSQQQQHHHHHQGQQQQQPPAHAGQPPPQHQWPARPEDAPYVGGYRAQP